MTGSTQGGADLPEPGGDPELARAFHEERAAGARLGFRVRCVMLGLVALMVLYRTEQPATLWYLAGVALTGLTGWLSFRLVVVSRPGTGVGLRLALAAVVAAEMALLAALLLVPPPADADALPAAMTLRLGNSGYLLLFVCLAALTTSPGIALWAGISAAIAWSAGTLWLLSLPGSFTETPRALLRMPVEDAVAILLHPDYVSITATGQEAALMILSGGVLGAAAWRARRLAMRQARAARDRAQLSRYFSPDVAERLLAEPPDLERTRRAQAAVLFADLKGFTPLAEALGPDGAIALLRRFHGIATTEVFRRHGTLHKFIGDEIMASFGAISPSPDPAASALACARGIAEAVAAWSAERKAKGEPPVAVAVGVHFGPVAVGDVGDARCMELALLGDTVNAASRLETVTRAHDAAVAASRVALDAARAETGAEAPAAGFRDVDDATLKGRRAPLPYAVWSPGDARGVS